MIFSVIVPVYNVEKYIKRCIKSLINQTFTDYEILLIDDGTPDNSGIICDEYAEKYKNIRVLHKENGGVASARNLGLEHAQGEYIIFVDSDDYVELDMLEKIHEEILINHSDIIYYGIVRNVFLENNTEKTILKNLDNRFFNINQDIEWKKYVITNKLYSNACSSAFKRSIINDNKLTFPNFKNGEDTYFTVKFLKHIKSMSVLAKILYNYVIYAYENSATRNYNKFFYKDANVIITELISFIGNDDKLKIFLCDEYLLWTHYNFFINTLFNTKNDMSLSEKCKYIKAVLSTEQLLLALKYSSKKKMVFLFKIGKFLPIFILFAYKILKRMGKYVE